MEEHGITPIELVAVNSIRSAPPFRSRTSRSRTRSRTLTSAGRRCSGLRPRTTSSSSRWWSRPITPRSWPCSAPARCGRNAGALCGQGVRPYGRLRQRHRGVPDAAGGRPPGAAGRLPGADGVAPLRREPQQRAALYVTEEPRGIPGLKQRQARNSRSTTSWTSTPPWLRGAVAHAPRLRHHQAHDPCGLAVAPSAGEAWRRALATDPQSAFAAWWRSIPWWTRPRRGDGGVVPRGDSWRRRSTRRRSSSSPPRRTCAWWSCR